MESCPTDTPGPSDSAVASRSGIRACIVTPSGALGAEHLVELPEEILALQGPDGVLLCGRVRLDQQHLLLGRLFLALQVGQRLRQLLIGDVHARSDCSRSIVVMILCTGRERRPRAKPVRTVRAAGGSRSRSALGTGGFSQSVIRSRPSQSASPTPSVIPTSLHATRTPAARTRSPEMTGTAPEYPGCVFSNSP